MPPPCIVIDAKKLMDIAKSRVNEINKIQETVNTINQAKTATQGIVSQIKDPAKLLVRVPNAETNAGPMFTGAASGNIATIASKTSDMLYAGSEGTADDVRGADNRRRVLAKDGNVEAYAYGIQKTVEGEKTNARLAQLSAKACKAKDLRGDWSVNSEIKIEMMNLREQQAYLLSAFLRMQASNNSVSMPGAMPKKFESGTISGNASSPVAAIDKSMQVRQLIDALTAARNILGSLGVVQMTTSAQDTIRSVITDYDATVARKAQTYATLQRGAQNWVNETKNYGSAQALVDRILTATDQRETAYAQRRALPIEQLTQDFALRNIDVNAMVANDVDPRQFIGNWTDPNKAADIKKMIDGLLNTKVKYGGLDGWVDGDNGTTAEVEQMVYDYNDARMEEAWKKAYADDAKVQLTETAGTIDDENKNQGYTVNEAEVTTRLKAIIENANGLGKDIGEGQDPGAKVQATDLLKQLQDLVGGGTSLPAVDVTLVNVDGTPVTTPAPTNPTNPVVQDEPVQPYNPRANPKNLPEQ